MAHRLLQRRAIVIAVDDNDFFDGVGRFSYKVADSLQRILYIKSVNINRKRRVGFGHNRFKKQNGENTKKKGNPFLFEKRFFLALQNDDALPDKKERQQLAKPKSPIPYYLLPITFFLPVMN